MRIVCQKCSAAYAIDDKFVTDRGVRAQCPRCRHLQLVKRDDAPPAGAPAALELDLNALPPPGSQPGARGAVPPAPSPFDFGGAPSSAAAAPSPFDFGSPPAPPAAPSPFDFGGQAPAKPAAPSPFDFGGQAAAAPAAPSPFDFGSPAGQPAAPSPFDFGGAPAAAPAGSPFDFGGAPPPPPPPQAAARPASPPKPAAASPFDFGDAAPQPSRAPAAAPAAASPFDFGTPAAPPSPFDMGGASDGSLELDTSSRSRGAAADPMASTAPPCSSCGKPLTDAFDLALGTCDECRHKLHSTDPAEFEHTPQQEVVKLSPSRPEPPPPTPSEPNKPIPVSTQVRSANKDGASGGGNGKLIGIAAGVLVVGGAIGAYLFTQRPWVQKAPPRVVKAAAATPKAIEAMVNQWRLNFPELEGESSKASVAMLEEGEQALLKDTTKGYLEAEEAFQKALVLDPSNERAVAGFALALAFGRGPALDDATARAAEGMLEALEPKSGDLHLYVAHAHLLIARNGNPNDIQMLAERAQNSASPQDKALAALAIGQAVLTKNAQTAETHFKQALEVDPKLKRAYFFQAQLAASVGRYADAVESLQKRLALDPDQWEAARELSRLYVEVGETGLAKKVLEAAKAAAPRTAPPRIALAVLSYQHLGELTSAAEQLQAVLDDKDVSKADRVEVFVHQAAIFRMTGDAARAAEAVQLAQDLAPEHVGARLQHLLVMLDKGVPSQARMDLDALKGKLGEPGLESALEGRLLFTENRLEEAVALLQKLAEAEPRRVEALLLAGAASAKDKKDGKAWEFCLKRGLKGDPTAHAVPAMTPLFVRPADILKPAVGQYLALARGSDEDPSPLVCEGMVAWYSEAWADAEAKFSKVLSIDPNNADAFAFRSMLALRKKDQAGALKLAERAIGANRTGALGYLAQGQALLAAGKVDLAKAAITNAQKYSPGMMVTRVLLGDIEARQGNKEEARRGLTSVLVIDSLCQDAKRALFKHHL